MRGRHALERNQPGWSKTHITRTGTMLCDTQWLVCPCQRGLCKLSEEGPHPCTSVSGATAGALHMGERWEAQSSWLSCRPHRAPRVCLFLKETQKHMALVLLNANDKLEVTQHFHIGGRRILSSDAIFWGSRQLVAVVLVTSATWKSRSMGYEGRCVWADAKVQIVVQSLMGAKIPSLSICGYWRMESNAYFSFSITFTIFSNSYRGVRREHWWGSLDLPHTWNG